MSVFMVTFRIEYDATWQDRYDSLRDRVNQIATSTVWDETTSCYVFQAVGTADGVCDDLFMKTKINASDTLLVVDITGQRYASRGAKNQGTLQAAMGG